MPDPTHIEATDVVGLLVIMFGLVCYRYGSQLYGKYEKEIVSACPCLERSEEHDDMESKKNPLLSPIAESDEVNQSPYVGRSVNNNDPNKKDQRVRTQTD